MGWSTALLWLIAGPLSGQTLLNVDFGSGEVSSKRGPAAAGFSTNDYWNLYSHYRPRVAPGMEPVPDGVLESLKLADGTRSPVAIAVSNAPGVWGNHTGDPMLDHYVFSGNGSNMMITLTDLPAGHYHLYLYGWANADVAGEQISAFTVECGRLRMGPLRGSGVGTWKPGEPWRDRAQVVTVRDLAVEEGTPVVIHVEAQPGDVAVVNGLQILSLGTSPPSLAVDGPSAQHPVHTNVWFRSIHYDGWLDDAAARFVVDVEAECTTTNPVTDVLFKGDIALLEPILPPGWWITKERDVFKVHASPGRARLRLEVVAQVDRQEPWNHVCFTGPPAAIATLNARAEDPNTEIQLTGGLSTAGLERSSNHIRGVLDADRRVALRWQARATEAKRDAVVGVDSRYRAHLTPAAIRLETDLRYEILQSTLPSVRIALPSGHTLTLLRGAEVKDWRVARQANEQILTVEFIRALEGNLSVELVTEQPLPSLPDALDLQLPQPLDVRRETGVLSVRPEDLQLRVLNLTGLRQVNTVGDEFASFRFSARPASLRLHLAKVRPEVIVDSRVNALIEDTRYLVTHELALDVRLAGLYTLDLATPAGLRAVQVVGDGVEHWKTNGDILRVDFARRVLGPRTLSVQLEQPFAEPPSQWTIDPVRVVGAARQSAFVGAASAPGIRLKTTDVQDAREIPVSALPGRTNELLAFRTDGNDWRILLSVESLPPRVVAEVFNLITLGDGRVGGSATIRYGILNQGKQEFRIRLPQHWDNIEFLGGNIRRKDVEDDLWTLSLQDKVWGAYTLVVTYDHSFDPSEAELNATGAHPLDVERETGTVAITSAANLGIEHGPITDPLRPVDPSEIAVTDRSLISRPVLLAYRYEGHNYDLQLRLTRHDELPGLDAVADRMQLTSVLTDGGEMLSQASFMVKNNERQYQRFQLPSRATLWGVAVNGFPVKAERDGDWVLVSLPRAANRDVAFAIDIKYAEQVGQLGAWLPQRLTLTAPKTDVPGTYSEWEVFIPRSQRLSAFSGNMAITRGTTYGLRDAWKQFVGFYEAMWHDYGVALMMGGGLIAFVVASIAYGHKRGFSGVVSVVVFFAILSILAAMMLPALSKAKAKAQRISSVNNLKQIGLAVRQWSMDHDGRYPGRMDEMMDELATDKVLYDPMTGQRYVYLGEGKDESNPNAVLAYSPERSGGHREVLLGDGSVQMLNAQAFQELLAKDAGGATDSFLSVMERTERAALHAGPDPGRPMPADVLPPTVAGIRSLKFDLPRAGRAYTFTRVLSLSEEPPQVSFRTLSTRAATFLRSSLELIAFLAGLGIGAFQWRRRTPRTLWVTVSLALALLATMDVFVAWRVLGAVLIVSAPLVLLLATLRVGWRWWARRPPAPPRVDGPNQPHTPPSVSCVWVIGFCICVAAMACASATDEGSASDQVSIVSASYSGRAGERTAALDATLVIDSGTTNQTVPLFGPELAVASFDVVRGEAEIWREQSRVGVLLPHAGPVEMRFSLVAGVDGDMSRRWLDLSLPPALGSALTLRLAEPDAEIELAGAISFTRTATGEETLIEAVLGSASPMRLEWSPRRKRGADLAATVFAQQNALVTVGAGVVNMHAALEWHITQGELQQLHVRLPVGQRLLRVSGEHLRSWRFGGDQTLLIADLTKPISPMVKLVVETEQTLDALPAAFAVALPEFTDVQRTSGLIGIRATDELALTVDQTTGLDRIDNTEFSQLQGETNVTVSSAWQFLRPEFDLQVRAELLRPQIKIQLQEQFAVGTEQLRHHSRLDYDIRRVGVFGLRLALPLDGRVERVQCDAMQTWAERNEDGRRTLDIRLHQRTLGTLRVDIEMGRSFTDTPSQLGLVGVHPLDADQLNGFVTVSAEAGVGLKTARVQGAREIPAARVPVEASESMPLLAFEHVDPAPQLDTGWGIDLNVEILEPWVRAEVVQFVSIGESRVTGRCLIRYSIQNAPTRIFVLKVPSEWRNVEISGVGMRRRDSEDGEWRVELQAKVFESYDLTVHWEALRPATNRLVVRGLELLDVQRETGAVAFTMQDQLQLQPGNVSEGVLRIDARELPAWAMARSHGRPVLSFRYLRPGWQLPVQVRRFEEAAVLQGLADNVGLRTVVADDGQHMTQIFVSIRNNGRQSLALTLPPGSRAWSAFVDGQPVRPGQADGMLLLPLERTGVDEAPVPVELTYVGQIDFPRGSGVVELRSPRLDLPLKDARWEVFLPPDFAYSRFKGTMRFESADLIPITQDFTLAEYQRQELSKKESWESRAQEFLRRTREQIAEGKLDRIGKVSQYRSQVGESLRTAQELERLEQDLNAAQGSNLLLAQEDYYAKNAERLGLATDARDNRQVATALDARLAQQQVAQLRKAQAVAETRVTPLRVNLPTRGLRYSFVQVLQTEPDKPLTIRMRARNDRETGWLKQLMLWMGGFLVLWAAAAILVSRRAARRSAGQAHATKPS